MRLLLLLRVALAHGWWADPRVGWPAPHVACGLPGPAIGLAPIVRNRLVDANAPGGGNGMGASLWRRRQRRGRRRMGGTRQLVVVGGLEVLGAAMLVAVLGHAHRDGALLA